MLTSSRSHKKITWKTFLENLDMSNAKTAFTPSLGNVPISSVDVLQRALNKKKKSSVVTT